MFCQNCQFFGCTPRLNAALPNVNDITVSHNPLLTAAAFAIWMSREECSLQMMCFNSCRSINCEALKIGAAKYNKALIMNEKSFQLD